VQLISQNWAFGEEHQQYSTGKCTAFLTQAIHKQDKVSSEFSSLEETTVSSDDYSKEHK